MNVLFVEKKLRTDKLGILYLSAMLKQHGHNTYLIQMGEEDIAEIMESFKPDFVCYSVLSGEQAEIRTINSILKRTYNFKSIFGGAHYTFFPEEKEADFIVIGAGENIINDIVEGKVTNKVIKGNIPDLSSLPYPDRSILYRYPEFGEAKMKRFIARRDCQYRCTYCFNHAYHKLYENEKSNFYQVISPEKTVQEILNVRNRWSLEMVYFNDDNFIFDKRWTTDFCQLYKEKIDLPFCGSIRANNVTGEILDVLKIANCYFMNIALESAVPETQKLLNRGYITNEQVKYAVRTAEEKGIKIRVQNMIGLPVDDPLQDALETLKFNYELNPTDSWVAIFQPYKGTEIYKLCLEKGLLDDESDGSYFYESSPLRIEDIEQINTLSILWSYFVKYKIDMDLVRILIKQPLSKNVKEELQAHRWAQTAKKVYKT